jgi:hypothetical protein
MNERKIGAKTYKKTEAGKKSSNEGEEQEEERTS